MPFTKGYHVSCGAYNVYQPDRGKDRKELVNKTDFEQKTATIMTIFGANWRFYPEI
jgi:hypothetical protein